MMVMTTKLGNTTPRAAAISSWDPRLTVAA